MATNYQLKPFYLNANDISYLLKQVNFVPLFDALGNAMVDWDGTSPVFNSKGIAIDLTGLTQQQAWDAYGHGFPQVSAPIGIRDVTGFHNNLYGTQADWGSVDVPFRRDIGANFNNYVTTPGADYSHTGSLIDYMPRIISRTITTAGVNLLTDGPNGTGHYVVWDPAKYGTNGIDGTDSAYGALINASGVNVAQLVEGAKIVAPVNTEIAILDNNGLPLVYTQAQYSAAITHTIQVAVIAATAIGGLKDASGGTLEEGEVIWYRQIPGGTLLNTGITYNPDLLVYKQLIDANVDFTTVPADNTAIVTTLTESGYGLLETLGHIDYQNPTSGEFFIGSENPGVAPVNSWFAIFGQFFDHGLDLIGKEGNGKITIALDVNDPLYRAPGTNGPLDQGNTKITVTRAAIDNQYIVDAGNNNVSRAGVDGKWGTADDYQSLGADNLVGGTGLDADVLAPQTPTYINHTSPFIDQSQTYGSVDQITQLLRKWVPDASTASTTDYKAAMELFDGGTLVDTWTRRWPDGSTSEVHDTLPTLNELRDHVLDTNRAALTWEDVSNYRNRAADGSLAVGDSGHALILDMNPRFDIAHLNPNDGRLDTNWDDLVAGKVSQAIADLNATGVRNAGTATTDVLGFTGGELSLTLGTDLVMGPTTIASGTVLTGATALIAAGWVNPADFSIIPTDATIHAAVGEILMAAVGDHYIAGDGRVNENFGLTSIHHVFHEEHNYQVENLKSWIYQHDVADFATSGNHDSLHAWQVNTGTTDAYGNYTYGVGGEIAWDADKMFNATKLLVEMEYQHAAVDQYARTITPRIQEFVGYSTGVDSTISLEYSQVAFRFGHSTIRETIDTLDPNGWFFGTVTKYALEKAFLNPQAFAEEGVAAITLGLSRQQMNEVDEFITPALNQGLLGQPLDLAAINIARGRDLGIPDLNTMREGLSLAKYTSWADFGANMIHPESLVNFIAAYSFNGDVALAEAAMQSAAFMNNQAGAPVGADGFNHIDAWLGGLAEAHVPGALLGETFDAVFVAQIQSLMDGDRFYYLYRLFGTNIHEEVNNGQFKDIVERNTGLEHLNGSIFAYADKYYDFTRGVYPPNAELHNISNETFFTDAQGKVYADRSGSGTILDPYVYTNPVVPTETLYDSSNVVVGGDHAGHAYADLVNATGNTKGIFSDGGASLTDNGSSISVLAADGIRASTTLNLIKDTRVNEHPDWTHPVEGTPADGADSHEVIVATDNADYIHARAGDDTVYGEGGDDYLFGDGGIDRLYGGAGDDLLDAGEGPDLADGGAGKDIIYGRGSGSEVGGFDQLVGGSGNDLIIGGEGIDKLSGGSGDDIIYGDGLTNPEMGNTDPFTHGGDGNDYIDTGASGDLLFGEEGDDYLVGGNDQDLIQGGQGDDIIKPGPQSQASGTTGGPDEVVGDNGQANENGFDIMDLSDWAGNAPGATFDFDSQMNPLVAIDMTSPMPAWFQIEGAIGTKNGDTFIGADALNPAEEANPFGGGNWLIGGSGDDLFQGRGGNDVIVGGSIRLDSLIGTYTNAATTQNADIGSMQWLTDAMASGGTAVGYDNNTENAYTGASNRAVGNIGTNGLLDAAGMADQKHFTEMLRSRMFKDTVLGDNGADGTADVAVFTGNLANYRFERLQFMSANEGLITAYRVTDTRTAADFLDANGDPLLDANGNEMTNEGSDLIVGIENLQFADVSIAPGDAFQIRPDGTLAFVPTDSPNGVANNNNAVRLTGANSIFATTAAVSYSWLDTSNVALTTTPSIAGNYVDAAGRLVLHTTTGTGTVVREKAVSGAVTITRDWNMIVGTSGNNAALTGADIAGVGDSIFGLAGTDTLNGGAGDDRLYGGTGNDALFGGTGNDYLDGGTNNTNGNNPGADQMTGGAGDDIYVIDDVTGTAANRDQVFEANTVGSGTDMVTSSNVSLDLVNYLNVENIGLDGSANINGTGNADANVITGNAGSNVLTGGGGDDTLNGGKGIDTAVFTGAITNYAFSLSGSSVVVTGSGANAADGADTLSNIERLRFGTGNNNTYVLNAGTIGDNVLVAGSARPELFLGFGGNDTVSYAAVGGTTANLATGLGSGGDRYVSIENLTGSNSGDTLTGDANANILNGGGGNDRLNGGGGTDALNGGDGTQDVAVFTNTVTDAGTSFALVAGNLQVTTAAGGTDTLTGIERAHFSNQANNTDYRMVIGTDLGNSGGAFSGSTNDDLIFGFGDIDTLSGGNGNDVLVGGAGNDNLTGGAGQDVLIGGADNDTFVFASTGETGTTATTRDIITGFDGAGNVVGDVINLLGIDANTLTAGNGAFLFAANATANSVWLTNDGTNTFINGDVNGNTTVDFQIQINGLVALNGSDFIL